MLFYVLKAINTKKDMGLFRTSDTIITQAMPLTAAMIASIDARPAWLFQNQSGTLGTNLDSSVVYCGVMPANASISAIMPGVVSQSVATFTLTSGGSGYQESGSANIVTASFFTKGTGLTVDITAPVPSTNASTPGTGYSVGTFTVAQAGGLSGTIDTVNAGAITGFTIIYGGVGYSNGDVLTIEQAGSGNNATISLSSAPNGAVTEATVGNSAGLNYSVGDVLTIAQAGRATDATLTVTRINLLPTAAQALTFTGLVSGSTLPVAVDYVTAVAGTGITVADFIIGR